MIDCLLLQAHNYKAPYNKHFGKCHCHNRTLFVKAEKKENFAVVILKDFIYADLHIYAAGHTAEVPTFWQ
jgi:hypothetical protein